MSFEFVNCPSLPSEIALDLIKLNEERQNPEMSSQISGKVYEVLLRTRLLEHVNKLEQYENEKPLSIYARVKIDEIDCILLTEYTHSKNMYYLSFPNVRYFDTLYKVAQEGTKYIFTQKIDKIWFRHVNLNKNRGKPG